MCLLFPTLIPTPIQMELDFIVISRRGYSGHRLIPMHVSIRCTDADGYFTQLVPISEFSSIFIVSLHGYQPSVAFLHIIGISLGIGSISPSFVEIVPPEMMISSLNKKHHSVPVGKLKNDPSVNSTNVH